MQGYILKLENNKYYIGKTSNLENRYKQHCNCEGAAWTRIHKPISILETFEITDGFVEDMRTKQFMTTYGINNVRGGSYTQVDLSEDQKTSLKREIRSAGNLCLRCGRNNHFVAQCYAKTELDGTPLPPANAPAVPPANVPVAATGLWGKIANEFNNPDSHLRTGKFWGF